MGTVDMQLAAGENMLLNCGHECGKRIGYGADPAGQCGARYLNSLSGVNLRRPEQRKMIAEPRYDQHEEAVEVRPSHVLSAAMAPVLLQHDRNQYKRTSADLADDLEALGDVLEPWDIFGEPPQLAGSAKLDGLDPEA
jgi:hypothetical protein